MKRPVSRRSKKSKKPASFPTITIKQPDTFEHNGEIYRVGEKVSLVVEWQGGRTTVSSGTLISIDNGEAFVETSLGPVAGNADTLERA